MRRAVLCVDVWVSVFGRALSAGPDACGGAAQGHRSLGRALAGSAVAAAHVRLETNPAA